MLSLATKLTPRERQVIVVMAEVGGNYKVIARCLGISPATVKDHLDSMRVKLGARNCANLLYRAYQRGYWE